MKSQPAPALTAQYVGGLKTYRFPLGYRCDRTARPGDWFDCAEAVKALRFIETRLVHVIGELAGEPLLLERWQRAIVANTIGWRTEDNLRRYRWLFLAVPRKNGKSTLCAALALTMLYLDGEPGAEVYSCASSRDQARIIFHDQAKQMVERSPVLSRRSTVYVNSLLARDPFSGQYTGRYQALAAEAGPQHGRNPSCTVFDEFHAQKTRELYDVMKTGQGARTQPLFAMITTAGFDRETVCYEQWELARQVADPDHPLHRPDLLPAIYAADPEKDDWRQRRTWKKANPNYGVSVRPEYLEAAAAEAATNPAALNAFLQLHLNIWTTQNSRAIDPTRWAACLVAPGSWPDLSAATWFAGLDLASSSDLTAYVRLTDHEGTLYVFVHFWVPAEAADKAWQTHSIDYRRWAAEGAITITEDDLTDYGHVRNFVKSDAEDHNIAAIGVDPYNATHLLTLLGEDGITAAGKYGMNIANLNEPFKDLALTRIPGQLLAHDGNPVLAWCVGNVEAKKDSGDRWRPVKAQSHAKIDGVTALVIANGLRIAHARRGPSVYESRGVITG